MLYRLAKAAFVHTELRADLVSLVRLGHKTRAASRDLGLRSMVIRTAYDSKNPELKRVLLAALVSGRKNTRLKHADARRYPRYRPAFIRWYRGRKFRNPDTGLENVFESLPSEERTRIYQDWQQGRLDWAQRHKPSGLGSETQITIENFNRVRPGDVIWRSDSPVKLHLVTKVDREGGRANSPTITMVQFDRGGAVPGVDDEHDTAKLRHMSKAAVRNKMLEYHTVPTMGARAKRERAQAALPQAPQGGWPKFQNLGLSEEHQEKLQKTFRKMQEVKDPAEVSLGRIKTRLHETLGKEAPRKAVKEFMHELRDWAKQIADAARDGGPLFERQEQRYRALGLKLDQGVSRLDDLDRRDRNSRGEMKRRLTPDMDQLPPMFLSRWDAETRGKMKPVFARFFQQGGVLDADQGKKLIKSFKDAGVPLEGIEQPMALGAVSAIADLLLRREGLSSQERQSLSQAQAGGSREAARLARKLQEEEQEQEQEAERRQKSPRRHQDRTELRGGGRKQMDAKAKLNSFFIGKILPEGASEEARAIAKEQLKKATYANLETLRKAAIWLDGHWDDPRAQQHPLIQNLGYDREGLKKLKKLIKRKLGDVNGRQYHEDVLAMANKYDLESEDADALYDWRVDKPARGRALSDQEKMNRFLAKAKPETRERMQGMSVADFMIMYKAILQEVLEDEEEIAAAV